MSEAERLRVLAGALTVELLVTVSSIVLRLGAISDQCSLVCRGRGC